MSSSRVASKSVAANTETFDVTQIPIEELILHRQPMLLVRKVLSYLPTQVEVKIHTEDSHLFANADGTIPAWVGIEYMAQAVATFAGLVARQDGEAPRLGFLLGTRKYVAKVNHFHAQQILRVTAEEIMRDTTNLVLFRCKIFCGDDELAQAEIKAIQPDDFAAAMAMFEKNE